MNTTLHLDPDVHAVLEFMRGRCTAGRLVPVAEAVADLAVLLWGHYEMEEVEALRLASLPIERADVPTLVTH